MPGSLQYIWSKVLIDKIHETILDFDKFETLFFVSENNIEIKLFLSIRRQAPKLY